MGFRFACKTSGFLALLVTALGCSDDSPSDGGPDGGMCSVAADCDDGLFCNGEETCNAANPMSDARGCVAGTEACPGMMCDEDADRCVGDCATEGDQDMDGQNSAICGGTDCDDSDPNRFVGNTEVCDAMDRDEDCDPTTFGFRDSDMDGIADAACCNTDAMGMQNCGTDCNDMAPGVNPTVPEVCDALDNDCDEQVDEMVLVEYWPDNDGDTFGDPMGMSMQACSRPMGFSDNNTDCDDTRGDVQPGAPEVCDPGMVDENCDGMPNPPDFCNCVGSQTRMCMSALGRCAAGVETCSMGAWGSCSIEPVTETCNGEDDNCDGVVDEGLTIVCYSDGDNDGYAVAGAMAIDSCPVMGRDAVGGCPTGTTNRAPMGTGNIDCNDSASNIRPGTTEVCLEGSTPVDEDCDGMSDEGVASTCYLDGDNDTYSPMGSMAMNRCRVAGRASVGFCPFDTTNRAPTTANESDCDDTRADVNPSETEVCDSTMLDEDCDGVTNPMSMCSCANGTTRSCMRPGVCASGTETCSGGTWGPCSEGGGPETCDGEDDDCDGSTDEGVQTLCFADGDSDGYAAPGAMVTGRCGGCLSAETDREPGGMNVDCNDADPQTFPGAPELCDGFDNDCDNGGGNALEEDQDGDMVTATGFMGCSGGFPKTDCNDFNPEVRPGQTRYFEQGYCPEGQFLCPCFRMTGVADACVLDPGMCPFGGPCDPILTPASYDYDCNGTNNQQPISTCSFMCAPDPMGQPFCGNDGPAFMAADCGNATDYRFCGGCPCAPVMTVAPQACR
ncbi:MAG: putative metal-binding motif-containing protein [Myxococcota bacterium]